MDHPFSNILLATEHTEFDAGSERVAFELARRCGLALSIVVPVLTNPEFEVSALVDKAEQEIASRIEELRKVAVEKGVSIDVHARRGESPAREIVSEAEERKADLVVIRRRGRRSFLAKLLVGEMVSQVVEDSPCSVLMVPRAAQMWSRGILAAVSGGEDGKVAAIAATIALECDLPLQVLCVARNEASRDEAERVVSLNVNVASNLGVKAQGMVLMGRPCDGILGGDADLIVIGMGKGGSGGTTRKVIGESEKPVLAVCV
ncbi:MAG TPA: universal stress protein [Burkholderiales bacterium]|nr:universal stress protein [Burkholderiales bacterium]